MDSRDTAARIRACLAALPPNAPVALVTRLVKARAAEARAKST